MTFRPERYERVNRGASPDLGEPAHPGRLRGPRSLTAAAPRPPGIHRRPWTSRSRTNRR